jgi:hypothetical protein
MRTVESIAGINMRRPYLYPTIFRDDLAPNSTLRNDPASADGATVVCSEIMENNHNATGDHTLYVGSVEYFEYREDKPLLFYAGGHQLIRG